MKASFVCKKHDQNLRGYPLWESLDADPNIFTLSYRDMHCPENPADTILKKCSESNWEVIVE